MIRTALVSLPIDVAALIAEVSDPSCGAITLFLGTVREVNDHREVDGIEYTAYETMASAELQRIANEAGERFRVERIAVEHRVGYLALGEASVAIAVAHPHRNAALDTSRWIIDSLKKRVPVWKREHYRDGTREWVDPTRASQVSTPAT